MAYLRMNAIISAMVLADRVAHDGRVGTKRGYPKIINGVELRPGMLLKEEIGAIDGEEDCAHFLSCCLGTTKCDVDVGPAKVTLRGGGLRIPSPFHPVFGQTFVPKLLGSLVALGAKIMRPQFRPASFATTRTAILDNLVPGDVLAWASRDNVNSYEHSAILVGPTLIACHTHSRRALDFSDVSFPWVTLVKLPN
jgi:hypothetical protein